MLSKAFTAYIEFMDDVGTAIAETIEAGLDRAHPYEMGWILTVYLACYIALGLFSLVPLLGH